MRLGTCTKLGAIQIGSLGVPLRGQAVVNRAPHFTGLGPSGFHPTRLRAPLAMPTRRVITCLRFEWSHKLSYIYTSMDSSLSHS